MKKTPKMEDSIGKGTQALGRSNRDEEEEEKHGTYAMQLVTSVSLPMALHATTQLGVFEIVAKAGPGAQLTPSEIAAQLPTTNSAAAAMLDRMLRLLASFSVFTCSTVDGGRVYGLSPVGKYFVKNEDGVSFGANLALLVDKVFIESWYELKNAVLEGGIPFNRVHGTHAFEYPSRDPRFNELFNDAMINPTSIIMKKVLESYKGLENLKQLVDVGGGLGVTLEIIISKYPSIKGINFDLPHVVQHAPQYPGVEHVGGDMFESVPTGDAIFMKWILHDWGDDHCLKLLENCYKALPSDGKVIILDAIYPAQPDTSTSVKLTSQADVLMMTQNPGGKERTEEEFLALATDAGFKGIEKKCSVFNLWVMEFYK